MLKLFIAIQNKLADARNEEGQTMAEYGVVLAVITAGIILALGFLSGAISDALDTVTAMLS
jgi:Flp pilus assembly pilin Flp